PTRRGGKKGAKNDINSISPSDVSVSAPNGSVRTKLDTTVVFETVQLGNVFNSRLDDPPIATLGGDQATVECPVQKDLFSVCTQSEYILSSGCSPSAPVSLQ